MAETEEGSSSSTTIIIIIVVLLIIIGISIGIYFYGKGKWWGKPDDKPDTKPVTPITPSQPSQPVVPSQPVTPSTHTHNCPFDNGGTWECTTLGTTCLSKANQQFTCKPQARTFSDPTQKACPGPCWNL